MKNYYKIVFEIKVKSRKTDSFEIVNSSTTLLSNSFAEAIVTILDEWRDAPGFLILSCEFIGEYYRETEQEIKQRKRWEK